MHNLYLCLMVNFAEDETSWQSLSLDGRKASPITDVLPHLSAWVELIDTVSPCKRRSSARLSRASRMAKACPTNGLGSIGSPACDSGPNGRASFAFSVLTSS